MMNLSQVFDFVKGAKKFGDGNVEIKRVHTDTRSLSPGDLFVALKGDSFDGNDYLIAAKAKGAVAAIAQHGLAQAELPGVEVIDSKLALGQLAAAWRTQFELPLIAVTGSNGKTTVTQMVASILRAFAPDGAFATEGNFNNDIGVPLTLLRLTDAHRIGVVELGMNHPGEISYLAGLVQPTVALVNNAQREHLEFMGTVAAVAVENGSVLTSLGLSGVAVFPADDVHCAIWRELAGSRKVMTFALDGPADVTAKAHWTTDSWQIAADTPAGKVEFELHVAGRHNVKNALAATACALAAGVPLLSIASGLSAFRPVKGRSRAVALSLAGHKLTLIDDTYNSNPDSMHAAIDVLAGLPGPRLLVMGDMGEVGSQGQQFHAEAGLYARREGINHLFTLGELSALASDSFGGGVHFTAADMLFAAVIELLPRVGCVLVKGSRFMQMERVVAAVTQHEKEIAIKNEITQLDNRHAA